MIAWSGLTWSFSHPGSCPTQARIPGPSRTIKSVAKQAE